MALLKAKPSIPTVTSCTARAVARSEERVVDEGDESVAKLERGGEEEDAVQLQRPEQDEHDDDGAHIRLTFAALSVASARTCKMSHDLTAFTPAAHPRLVQHAQV